MSQKTWEINGVSLPLDLEDADAMERYERAFEEMAAEEKQLPKDGRNSERIRAYCNLFRRLYDRIFGDGTAERIFKDTPTSAVAYDDVYYQFLAFIREQTVQAARQRAERLEKYRPNRKMRRSTSK
jgi:hypothetical protein